MKKNCTIPCFSYGTEAAAWMCKNCDNLFWIILAAPFYVVILICCAYSVIVLKGIGIIFEETEPYKPIDKLDLYIYDQAKKYLIQ